MPVGSVDYPGLRPGKKSAKTKDLKELSESEARLPEKAIQSIPAFHVSQSRSGPMRSTRGRRRWVFLPCAARAAIMRVSAPQPEAWLLYWMHMQQAL